MNSQFGERPKPRAVTSFRPRGATLSEVMIGMALFAMFSLAILGLIIQSAKLDAQEEENTQLAAVAQQLLELEVDKARTFEGYAQLTEVTLAPTSDPQFLYRETVREVTPGLKKITVTLFHARQSDPETVDTARPRQGEALTLSVIVGEPHP